MRGGKTVSVQCEKKVWSDNTGYFCDPYLNFNGAVLKKNIRETLVMR